MARISRAFDKFIEKYVVNITLMIYFKEIRVRCQFIVRYGLPVNFQAMLLRPQKKGNKRLRDVLNQLYAHLDNSAYTGAAATEVSEITALSD